MTTDASVWLWGTQIGAVTWLEDREIGVFQYTPQFQSSGIELAPLTMPLAEFPYEFPALARNTFMGLPGLLADSLPDKYGHAVIDAWLASKGQTAASFHPVKRLCYIGSRGMGALEFEPAATSPPAEANTVEVAALVELANQILDERSSLGGVFTAKDDRRAIEDILRVGTSAGGARAKAILAWNEKTGEFRSGQVDSGESFEHWLMKFDGVANNRDKELADPQGYGKVEYAYYLMARAARIDMTECRLHHKGGRSHFMTRRFDRTRKGGKRHMQSLGAMAHYDYNQPASYSYEQALQVMRRLNLGREDMEQQVRRAMFNVVARNQDDHVKNIAFLMNKKGEWRLSPAFDVAFSWTPDVPWTSQHQMSVNGKRDDFAREDLIALGAAGDIKTAAANRMLNEVLDAVSRWRSFADEAEVKSKRSEQIESLHRLKL